MTPDLQPILQDSTVRLRPLKSNDYNDLLEVASDPQIWAGHPAHDRWKTPIFKKFFNAAMESGGAMIVEDITTGAVIGSTRFDPRHTEPDEIEIGWTFLACTYWGSGVNATIKRLMIRHALQYYGRVIFRVGAENLISRHAMANIGAMLTNRATTDELAGKKITHVIFAIDHSCFENGPLG